MFKNVVLVALVLYVAVGLVKPPVYSVMCVTGKSSGRGAFVGCAPFVFTDKQRNDAVQGVKSVGGSMDNVFFVSVSRLPLFFSSDVLDNSRMEFHYF